MAANTEEETEVNAQGTDVGTGLAAHPEDGEVAVVVKLNQLRLVDCSDAQLALDGRDQRRSLEEGTSEGLDGLWFNKS